MNDFEHVLQKVRIENIISSNLGRSGKSVGTNIDFGECPFCGGHNCFRVNTERQFYNCFQCDAGGNAINFVRHYNKLPNNFDALKILAKKIGHTLNNGKETQKKSQFDAKREKILGLAASYYHQNLLKNEKALTWFKEKRKHTDETIKQFMIGWSGNDDAGLYKFLTSQDISKKDIESCGLAKKNEKTDKIMDFLLPHLYIFPWQHHSLTGHFTIKDPTKKIDYQLPHKLKSSNLLFYNQSHLFYNQIIIVEGENDLLTVYRALQDSRHTKKFGVIGIHGQLSGEQIKYLEAHLPGKELYCCFDNDKAGENYSLKLIDQLSNKCEVCCISFSRNCKDIDEYLRESKNIGDDMTSLIKNSIDGIEWIIDSLDDCDHPLKVRKVVEPALKVIAKISDDRLDAYMDLLMGKFSVLKRANLTKQLKSLGANIGTNVIHNFEIYDSTSQIFVSQNCYWIPTKDDKRMISNFTFKLINIYAYEDSITGARYLKYECTMKNYKGIISDPIVFEPDERVNVMKFMAKAASLGEFHFWGSGQNLMNVWSFVEHSAKDVRITNLIQKYGYLVNHDLWLFENIAIKGNRIYAEKNGIINVNGKGFKSENVLVYGGDKPVMNTESVDDEFIAQVVQKIWQVSDGHAAENDEYETFKGLLLIGFIPAMIYRREIMAKFGLFPLLTCYGPSQTGKSVITQILFSFWGFNNPAEAWEGMTPPGLTQFLSQLDSLPVWLDEFRNNSNRFHKTLMGLLRNTYNGVAPGKGGLQRRLIFQIGGCLWLSGEDTPDDRATVSRCAVARFTEINPVRDEAYQWFQDQQQKLSSITVKLITEKTKERGNSFLENINAISDVLLQKGITDQRTRINIAIPVAGFYMFNYRSDDSAFQERFLDYISLQAEEDRQRKAGEDILTKFFEDMARLMELPHFQKCVKIDSGDRELMFNFNEFYAEYSKELRSQGDDIKDFKKSTIRDYIVKSPYFINNDDGRGKKEFVCRFGEKTKRGFKLDINKMPQQIQECFVDLINEQIGF